MSKPCAAKLCRSLQDKFWGSDPFTNEVMTANVAVYPYLLRIEAALSWLFLPSSKTMTTILGGKGELVGDSVDLDSVGEEGGDEVSRARMFR